MSNYQLNLFSEELPVQKLIAENALFVCNHSGGKDSQAMYLFLKELVPADQLVVIHAHLPEVEWPGVIEHINTTITSPLYVVQAKKTFFEMVEHRQMWPSPTTRQCTSDLKRGPIEKQIRALLKDRPNQVVVNCMGLRAEESPGRAKKAIWKLNTGNSIAGRTWFEWLPIHHLTSKEVFENISKAGQQPHWAYAAGMNRLSCCFCIMASDADLKTAARLNPELAARYIETEKRIDHTFKMPVKGQKLMLSDILKLNP